MSSFLTGLMSVGKKIGGAAENWAQGTKIGRDIDKARGSTNPWYQKNKPTQAGGTDSSSNGSQSA